MTTRATSTSLSGAALHAFLEVAPDAIAVVDTAGSIVLVNSLAEKMFGYLRDELIGRPIEILVPDRFRVGHVAHRASYFREPRTRPMGEGRELATFAPKH